MVVLEARWEKVKKTKRRKSIALSKQRDRAMLLQARVETWCTKDGFPQYMEEWLVDPMRLYGCVYLSGSCTCGMELRLDQRSACDGGLE